ncbi:MAG: pilus assembly protein N-terminal domain-containing protein, partial [Candidatus Gastranaerophilales bacterium]|nr:pilus assembly protein N-terminal domain-containing protein [Candidatus Gastranaerophilales bacterium]
ILLITLFLLGLTKAVAVSYVDTPVPNSLGKSTIPSKSIMISPYKDNNEKLYAVVGKTQMIKFDEPVKRISITDPSLADLVLLSPKELLLNGKKAGRTSLLFWGSADKPVFFNMVVQQDTDAVIQAIEQIAPNENIKYNFTDDGLILSGKVSSTNIKKNIEDVVKAYNIKFVDLLESPTKQVLLEVKITEASRNFTKTLASQFSVGQDAANLSGISLGNIVDGGNALFNGTAAKYLFSSPSANIAWAITAAETKGLIRILAEPKLLAIDGQPGSFNVGQEIPYPASVGLSSTTSYSFKNTGVILNFTPTILEKSNRVILKLSPEVSEIDESYKSGVAGVPGFKTRKVDTTVELADGETLVIAGLLSHSTSSSNTQVPGIGDIPVIGFLFSNFSRTKKETELVIFITPKIVEADRNNTGMEL